MADISKEQAVQLAREAGFKASIGKTDKDGKYHPNVNALSKDVPVEWVQSLAQAAFKLGRNAGLEEAKQKIEALADNRVASPPQMHALDLAADAIESLKDNTP